MPPFSFCHVILLMKRSIHITHNFNSLKPIFLTVSHTYQRLHQTHWTHSISSSTLTTKVPPCCWRHCTRRSGASAATLNQLQRKPGGKSRGGDEMGSMCLIESLIRVWDCEENRFKWVKIVCDWVYWSFH